MSFKKTSDRMSHSDVHASKMVIAKVKPAIEAIAQALRSSLVRQGRNEQMEAAPAIRCNQRTTENCFSDWRDLH